MRSPRRNPYRFGVDFRLVRRTPLRDPASSYTPLGGGADTLPHREAGVSGVGSPRLEPRSSLGTPARCMWLLKACMSAASVGRKTSFYMQPHLLKTPFFKSAQRQPFRRNHSRSVRGASSRSTWLPTPGSSLNSPPRANYRS